MCVAAVAWEAHPRWRLVVAANRDEFHERPSAPLGLWDDAPGIIAGRDLRSGGTWLGVSESGAFVLVTNFRVPGYPKPERPSRGGLVTGLLTGDADPASVAIDAFNPFNLLHADAAGLRFIGNHPRAVRRPLPAGVHGVSNGALPLTWPKARATEIALAQWLRDDGVAPEPLFAALRRESPLPADVPADALPGTQPEPRFAPVFIIDPVYGTRCSTVVTVDRDGRGSITERRFAPDGSPCGESSFTFRWPGDTAA